jgi:hypothetical protein
MTEYKHIAFIAAAAALVAGMAAAPAASAETQWQASHPRRAEVNNRLANQNRRIHNKVADGQMTKGQAAQLHRDDHQIRQEEQGMAHQNGSHITSAEDRALNQQENANSRAIHNE